MSENQARQRDPLPLINQVTDTTPQQKQSRTHQQRAALYLIVTSQEGIKVWRREELRQSTARMEQRQELRVIGAEGVDVFSSRVEAEEVRAILEHFLPWLCLEAEKSSSEAEENSSPAESERSKDEVNTRRCGSYS